MTKNNGNSLTLTTFWLKELLVSVNRAVTCPQGKGKPFFIIRKIININRRLDDCIE